MGRPNRDQNSQGYVYTNRIRKNAYRIQGGADIECSASLYVKKAFNGVNMNEGAEASDTDRWDMKEE